MYLNYFKILIRTSINEWKFFSINIKNFLKNIFFSINTKNFQNIEFYVILCIEVKLMLKKENELKNRSHYLEKLIEFKDTDFVKIITGIRRCGKSSLMKLMIKHLLDNGIEKNQIIQINFESMEFKRMTVEDLYNYVKSNLPKNKKAYLFFDEIQKVPEWQDAINSFRVDF